MINDKLRGYTKSQDSGADAVDPNLLFEGFVEDVYGL